ncbi:MAG: glycerol-3-phosphate 1-O-acyltransferase PlsY [Halanaerobiales bacterium]|nr:glycerol-3-phosphate 1-O-acyltransferase PlsY [Halanaerobiales bacterium]
MAISILMILSYLIGAIPFAFIFTKLVAGTDVRKIGSGNVGATNTSRILGLKYGVVVGILDVLKGFLAVFLLQLLLPENASEYWILVGAVLSIIGHNWSIFLKFTGGKGVATTFGVVLRTLPLVFIICTVLIWLIVVVATKYVSLASMLGAISLPIQIIILRRNPYFFIFAVILALFIVVRHHSNIKRLFQGCERRLSWPARSK